MEKEKGKLEIGYACPGLSLLCSCLSLSGFVVRTNPLGPTHCIPHFLYFLESFPLTDGAQRHTQESDYAHFLIKVNSVGGYVA